MLGADGQVSHPLCRYYCLFSERAVIQDKWQWLMGKTGWVYADCRLRGYRLSKDPADLEVDLAMSGISVCAAQEHGTEQRVDDQPGVQVGREA